MHLTEDLVSDRFESVLWQIYIMMGSFPSWLRRLTVNKLATLPHVRIMPTQSFYKKQTVSYILAYYK